MKTLQEIKDDFGVSKGFKNWEEFSICFFGAHIEHSLDELFFEVAREALKNAAENAMLIYTHYMSSLPTVAPKYTVTEHSQGVGNRYDVVVYKHSIRDENNIPKI